MSNKPSKFGEKVILAAGVWSILALVATALYTFGNDSLQAFGLSILLVAGAAAVGAILGFLFGVPKTIPQGEGAAAQSVWYQPNSNLEQVSDWLTKILVGVSLVQIRSIVSGVRELGVLLGLNFGDSPGAPGGGAVYATTLLIFSVLIGFLLNYMWVRTRFFDVLAAQQPTPVSSSSAIASTSLGPSSA